MLWKNSLLNTLLPTFYSKAREQLVSEQLGLVECLHQLKTDFFKLDETPSSLWGNEFFIAPGCNDPICLVVLLTSQLYTDR